MISRSGLSAALLTACVLSFCNGRAATAQDLARFDFTIPQTTQEWEPTHDVAGLKATPEGLRIDISGSDPYIHGPQRDYPAGQPLWLTIRLKSQQGGMGQVFYFTQSATEENSVRFPVRADRWESLKVALPPLGPGYRLRLDPPGTGGYCIVSSLSITPRILIPAPEWPAPVPPTLGSDMLTMTSGDLKLMQAHHQLGGFEVDVAGKKMAIGNTRPLIGYLHEGKPRWFALGQKALATASWDDRGEIISRAVARDEDGATWQIEQRFSLSRPGVITVSIIVCVDQVRELLFAPLMMMFAGAGSFGETKQQALFAGLEYLDKDEPSSSEADVIGPASHRQLPDAEKITLPLMAVQQGGRYIGLTWDPSPRVAALFDSPDRIFHSGGHLLALIAPCSNGANHPEDSLIPYEGHQLTPGQALTVRCEIMGGTGESVVPAIQQAVLLHGLPATPSYGLNWTRYAELVAAGWLNSGLRVGDQFRHAVPNFQPQPAADAAVILDYLACQTKSAPQAKRLSEAAQSALTAASSSDLNSSGVGHVRYPVASLVFGDPFKSAEQAAQSAQADLSRFGPDGSVPYLRPARGPDLGKTHFARESNGMAAQVVDSLLESAVAAGDIGLIEQGIQQLRTLDRFGDSAPRGAQTWEVPLHTPDILASAYLVRAYTLGYELTGDTHLLARAKYWAWTGVPFVYLTNPTDQKVGPYATIAVYGATQWVAPVWMGLPVQWCGLVYADALYRLKPDDPGGPWDRLADGITASGIQQTWPLGSDPMREGLLPDSFDLKFQNRNDPAINPATLFTEAVRLYDRLPLYDFHAFLAGGALVHVPGRIERITDTRNQIAFEVQGWPRTPYQVLITGLKKSPRVRINGKEVSLTAPNRFSAQEGRLTLEVTGTSYIRIDLR